MNVPNLNYKHIAAKCETQFSMILILIISINKNLGRSVTK